MSEKSMKSSRFLLCLTTISISILLLSSVFLLQSSNTNIASIPRSVFRQILVNTTSVFSNNGGKFNSYSSLFSTIGNGEPKLRTQLNGCKGANFALGGWGAILQQRHNKNTRYPTQAVLRVFMYDLPPRFHFGLLGWKGKDDHNWPNVSNLKQIPSYPGGLNLQHSIEYWLTLDLLSSNTPGFSKACSAVRVENSTEADVIFVPFFSSLSYNRHSKLHGSEKVSKNKMLQYELEEFLMNSDEWKRCGGKDHVIVAHHPNSMLEVRRKLGSAIFVLADFGRYPPEVANLEKDIIAPYRHVVRTVENSSSFDERPTLVYFQGAIYRKDGGAIRQELYYLLKDEKDVHFTFGSVRGNGTNRAGQGMASSKFCLNIAGDTPSSNRLFDAIVSHCVPVIVSDEIELPFEDVLDYSEFCIFVRASDALKEGFLLNLLRGINRDEWTRMWERLKQFAPHFEYAFPSHPGDAVDMIWKAVSRKVSSIHFNVHRNSRFYRSQSQLLERME